MSRTIIKGQTVYGAKSIFTNGLGLYLDAGNIKSYIGSGNSWNNLISNTNNATLYNNVLFSSSDGGYMIFDGLNNYANFSYTWDNDFTVNLWINPISYKSNFSRILGSSDFSFEIGISLIGMIKYFSSWTDTNIIAPLNQWINLTFVRSGTSIKVYSNGVLKYTGIINVLSSGGTVYLGSNYLNSEKSNIKISNISIYNKTLNDSEVLQNYNATKSRFGY